VGYPRRAAAPRKVHPSVDLDPFCR
jgi:hypothetical protein